MLIGIGATIPMSPLSVHRLSARDCLAIVRGSPLCEPRRPCSSVQRDIAYSRRRLNLVDCRPPSGFASAGCSSAASLEQLLSCYWRALPTIESAIVPRSVARLDPFGGSAVTLAARGLARAAFAATRIDPRAARLFPGSRSAGGAPNRVASPSTKSTGMATARQGSATGARWQPSSHC